MKVYVWYQQNVIYSTNNYLPLQTIISTCSEKFRKISEKTFQVVSFQSKMAALECQSVIFLKGLCQWRFLQKFSQLWTAASEQFKIASSDLIQFLITGIFSAGLEHTLYKISVTMRYLENRTQRIFNNSIKQKQKLGSPVHCREPRFQRPNLRPESRNFGIPRKMMFLDLIFSLCFQISRKLGVNNNICSFLIT